MKMTMNYARFLNKISQARQPSPIRVLTAILQQSPPSMISMAGGMPNVGTFPIESASFKLVDGSSLEMDSKLMKQALQYCPTPGVPDLIKWLKGLQEKQHNIADQFSAGHTDLLVTNGSQDGICKAFEALVSPGDNVLIETPSYPGTLAVVKPMDCKLIPVQSDSCGLNPNDLSNIMSKWSPSDAQDDKSDIPKVLYLIPNGGNPTGHGLTMERKKEIYSLAQKYNLIPYVSSLLSMDVDGRVVRFDSFSKLISSGMRIGTVTGPKPVLDRISLHMQASVMHASSLSQVVLCRILEQWGYEGLAEWSEPSGGMFLWLKLSVPDTYELITVKAREREVLFVPGSAFTMDDTHPSQHVRASYSTCSEEQMNTAFERLAGLIREEQMKGS
ncbi:AADAT-like protein [Mya arenaria]|uniref:AADAT-like protein n=1 Tax=Mya arenaria TaxID=6604 RepID=A0ABY7FR23_MYAAR|nr:AADAT-like protein [Mya arenaria]